MTNEPAVDPDTQSGYIKLWFSDGQIIIRHLTMKVKIVILFALLAAASVLSQDEFDPSLLQGAGEFFFALRGLEVSFKIVFCRCST
jgi:hypothetical protein